MLEVPERLRRGAHQSESSWLRSARELIDLVSRECGRADLAGTSVLDIGCGTKITKVLLDDERPIGRYVGIDVEPKVIQFLESSVDDPRFEFHHIDVKNDLYNPDGLPLDARRDLPVGDERFDIIWLFSVFTHLNSADYVAMLRLLRNYVADDGWLVFSLFINEVTDTGYGPLDWRARPYLSNQHAVVALSRKLDEAVAKKGEDWFGAQLQTWWDGLDDDGRAAAQEQWARQTSEAEQSESSERATSVTQEETPFIFMDEAGTFQTEGEPPDFLELIPEKPLLAPLFSRRHAIELFEGTGWEIVSLNPPKPQYIQHYFVCRPA